MRVFKETQRFNQWWMRLVVVAGIIICGFSIGSVFNLIEEDPLKFWIVFVFSLVTIAVLVALLFFVKLETKIDEQGIHYKFWPFNRKEKNLKWAEIRTCHVRKYSPLTEYGGWGYRAGIFRSNNGALNVKGNKGIQIKFNNGKQLLVGTQRENEASRVLKTYSHKIN